MHLIIYIILIFAFCIAGACINTEGQTGETPESLLKDTDQAVNSKDVADYRIDLDETILQFRLSTDIESERIEEIRDYIETDNVTPTVHQIIGTGVDRDGNADSWILGIRYNNIESLIYPEITGWRQNIWPGPLPEEEIDTCAIIMPSELFLNNAAQTDILFENSKTGKTSVLLINGVYYISSESSDDNQEIKFNAYTGEVIL